MSWRVFLLGVCLSLLWKYSNAQLPYIGLQFTTELPDQSFQLIASCYSGANVIASSANQVYTSTDYGYTFTLSAFSNSAPYSFSWIDISGNGQTYYAAANSPAVTLYRSNTPQSSSWTATASIASVIPGITAMDVDQSGLHVVLVYGTSNPNNIYAAYSADNATTFTVLTGVTSPCTSVAIDSTGASIAAASIDGYIFVSSNSGQTFVKHLVYGASYNLNVAASAYSKNKYIYAMNQASSTTMMKSSDYGANWTAQTVYTTTAVSTSLPFSCSGSGSTLSLNLGNVLIASKDYAVQWAEVLQIIAIGNSFNQVVVSGNGESIYLATAFGIMLSHSNPAVIPTMLPTFAPSVAPTKTLSPTVTRAPTTPLPPTTKWPTVALPGQGGGYVGLAMNTGGTFFVAIPLMGEPVFVTANANGGYKIVEGYYPYTGPWQTVAMSNDGNRVIYVGGYTLMFSISMQPNIEYGWENIFYTAAISGDGSTVVAASYSYTEYYPVSIYINQPGQPFVPQMTILKNIVTYPTGANLVGIALNYDGHTITLLLTNRDIYLSKNQGASFTILNALCSTTMTPSMTYFMSAYNNGSNLVVASTTNNTMLYSMNQGQSWQQSNTSNLIHPTTMFSSVAGSDSGQFMIMASNNAIYTSANFGQNWTYANPLWGNITSNAIGLGIVASDSIGSHVAFVETNSNLLYIQMIANIPTLAPSASPTFRPSATPTISPTPSPTTTAPSTSMAPSVTPTTSQPSISPTPFPTTTKPSVTPTVQIQQDNFLQYDAGNSFFYMTMDATGTIGATTSFYQVYVSLNSGLTWALVTQPLANGNWRNLVLSGNGEYLYVYNFASPTLLYRASNASSFNQWTTIGNQLMTYANSLDTDYTGKYVAACGGSGIQLSSNYGVDFAYLPAIPGIFPGTVYYAVSMDNTGAYFTVADGAGNVYYTTNYGQSFNTSQAFVDNAGQFIEALITSAGNANQYQYAFTSASLCVAGQSVNGGKLWQSIVIDPNAVAVTNYIYAAISANGQFVAFIYNQYVYYSSDYGKSFEIIYTYYSSNGGTLNGIAINSAGSIIFLASTNGIFSYRANTPNTLPPSFSPTFAPTTQNTVINFPIATAGYGYVAVSSNAEYITAVPPYQVYGGAATFYTANTGQIVQVGNFMDSSQVCMSDDARYQILMLDYLAYYVVDYNFQGLTTAKLNTTLTYINSLNWCAMTSSGNVSIIGTQNTSPQLLFIYVQNGNFQPYFYPVKSYPSTTGTSVTGIEIDNTGQIIAAILTTGEMHLSTNQGKTWTTIPALRSHIPLNVVSFTMSLTANSLNQQDMIAVSTNSQFLNGAVSYSNNTGSTWQSNTQGVSSTTYPWSNIDSSATGQYAAVVGDGIVYLSKDFGHSWSHVYAMPNLNTAKVSIDPTGHYTAISQYSSNQIILLQTMNVPTFAPTYSMAPTTLRPTYPITSTPSNPPVFPPTAAPTMQQKLLPFTMVTMPSYGSCCNAIATSANGSAGLGYFYASPTLYIFTRYGFSWTTVPGFNPPALFSAVAVSGDGHLFLAAAGAVLYSSTNPTAAGGWVAFPSSSTLLTSTIIDIAVSTNGNYIVLVTGSAPYAVLSSNGGQSFTVLTGVSTAGNNGGMSSVTMDSTGLFIALATAYGYVYVSTNGGNSFTSNQVLYATIINSVAIAGSSAKKNQNLYVSSVTTSLSSTATTSTIMSNNQQGLSTAWVSDEVDPAGIVPTGIAVTSNGKTVVLVTKYQVFMNNNFGNANDWYVILNGADLCSIAIDANGTNIYIGAQYFVYMYHNDSSITATPTPAPSFMPYVIPPPLTDAPVLPASDVINLPAASQGYNLVALSTSGNYATATQAGSAGKAVFYSAKNNARAVTSMTGLWTDLSMSSDGSIQVLIGNNAVYYVTGYSFSNGLSKATFNTGLSSQFTMYCALNGNGNVLVVAQSTTSASGVSFPLAIYVNPSATYQTFVPVLTPITSVPTMKGNTINIALDSTGQIISMFTSAGYLYVSSNQGATWKNPSATGSSFIPYVPYGVNSFAMSQYSQGKYMTIAATSTLGVYYSTNQGKYFNYTIGGELSTYSYGGWYNLASSYSGQIVVGAMNQGVFVSTDYGLTWKYVLPYYGNNAYVASDPVGDLVGMVCAGSSQIALYRVPNVPTPAPTTLAPTISSAPTLTRYPTFPPTPSPSTYPTPQPLTTGWLYNGFYAATDCSGPELLLEGYRLGSCMLGNGGSFYYSCNGNMAITTTFATVNCTGNPIKISQNAVNIPQPYIPYGCIQFSCETSSTSLPLDSSLSFTVIEYYDVGENVCVNAMLALAEVNDVCVNVGVNASIYAHYPWAASYLKAGCNPSDLEFNVTYPSGCTNKDSTGDDDDFYVIPNKASASSAYSPLIVEPFFPLSFDAEDVSTATGMLRGAAEDNKVPVEEMVAAFIERHQARLIRLNEQNLAKKKRQEGKNDPRELSIWYGNDNNDDSGTPTETAQVFFVPAASSSSSSNTLSAGAIAGIAIGAAAFCTMAVVIIAVFVFGSSTVLGWCGLKMAGEGNKKGGDDGDDVAPSTEMSFDYGSQKSSISGVTSVVNPILARPSNPTA